MIPSDMDVNELPPESVDEACRRFYDRLFSFLSLNEILVKTFHPVQYICKMNDSEYWDYLNYLTYLEIKGQIAIRQGIYAYAKAPKKADGQL
ncbi:MAG: hypothetical protein QXN55_00485 [Candidatus Nitrosotenuis sp.]